MAKIPAASRRDADERGADDEDVSTDPDAPGAPPAFSPEGKDEQGTGGSAGVFGPDSARIGNWPDPM
jgi:hypothetical protein